MHLKPSKHHAYYCNMGLNGLCVYSLSEGGGGGGTGEVNGYSRPLLLRITMVAGKIFKV